MILVVDPVLHSQHIRNFYLFFPWIWAFSLSLNFLNENEYEWNIRFIPIIQAVNKPMFFLLQTIDWRLYLVTGPNIITYIQNSYEQNCWT